MFAPKRVLVALAMAGALAPATSAARTQAAPRPYCTITLTRTMFIHAVQATYAGTDSPHRGAYRRLWRYGRCGRDGPRGYHVRWARQVWGVGLSRWEARRAALAAQQAAANITTRFDGWAIPSRIVYCESGYANLPPNGASASGYYQMLDGTWQSWASSAGLTNIPPEAYEASRTDQGIAAAYGYDSGGTSPWAASQGCWG